MIFHVTPGFYAELLWAETRSDGNYIIENDNGDPYTAVKVVDNQITASDHISIEKAVAWLSSADETDGVGVAE
jgi:hypothetical protein